MWQKPAKTILDAHDVFRNILAFIFFCIMSGYFGFLVQELIRKKADFADTLSLTFLSVSMLLIYGF